MPSQKRRSRTQLSACLLAIAALGVGSASAAPTVSVVIEAAEDHPLDLAWGIVLDNDGNLFVAGYDSDNVLQRTPGGVVSVSLGPAGDGVHPLDGPTQMAIGADGSIYVVGSESRNVFRKPPGMPWVQILDATGDGAGHPLYPWQIAVDGSGNVFVTSVWLDVDYVLKRTPGGAVSVVIDETGDGAGHTLDSPSGLATDAAGNLYVTGAGTDNIFQVTPAGAVTQILESTPSDPLDSPRGLLAEADGTLYVTGGGFAYRRDPVGTLTELSSSLYAEFTAPGPNGTLLLSTAHEVFGLRDGAPRCRILDLSGNGALPFDLNYGAVTAPDGTVYATGRTKVFRIDGACGPAPDVAGRWLLTSYDPFNPEDPPSNRTQTWSQSGFDLTVVEEFGGSYTGTIDDAGNFDLDNDAPYCSGMLCCSSASTIRGTVSTDGIRWNGNEWPIFFGIRGCQSSLPSPTSATRLCDDGNTIDDDGCDASGNIEACWKCDGSEPSICTANVLTCASGGGGGNSLRAASSPRLQWKLPTGPASMLEELGDPTVTTDYALCVFDRSGAQPAVLLSARAPAGSGWRATGSGYSLKSSDAPYGVRRLTIKSGSKTRAVVKTAGDNLALPALSVALPLTVQLQTSDAACFEASYSPARMSVEEGKLKAEADPLP